MSRIPASAPARRSRAACLAALAALGALGAGCGEDPPARSIHGQRNLAYLHATRDSDAGYEAAIEILAPLVAREDATFEDALNLARALVLHSKRTGEAADPIARARRIGSDPAGLAALDYVEGLFHKGKQDHRRAQALFGRVLTVRADHPEALYQCGYAAELAGDFPDARRRYERLIGLGQLVRPAAYRLSKVAARLNDTALEARAIALFESRDKAERPETTKCDLTDVSLRRFDRKGTEPPSRPVAWEVRGIALGEPVQQAIPVPGPGDAAEVVFLGRSGVIPWTAARGPQTAAVPLQGRAVGVAIDLDNAAGTEIVLCDEAGFAALERGADGRWRKAAVEFPAPRGGVPACMAVFDEDHDGDLDVVLITGGGEITGADHRRLLVLRNRGDRRFEWKEPFAATVAAAGPVRLDGHDLDQANDLDLVLPGGDDRTGTVSINLRSDRYRLVPVPELGGRTLFAVEDFDNDGAPDVFAAGGGPGCVLLRNADPAGRPYQVRFAAPERYQVGEARDLATVDLDGDGDLDLLLATGEGVIELRNSAGALQHTRTAELPGGASRLAVADLEPGGGADLLAISDDGRCARITWSDPPYPSLTILPQGRKDNRAAVGTVTEVHAGRTFQSRMIKGPFGVRVGLGSAGLAGLDGLRLRWPQGILQAIPVAALEVRDGRVRFRQIEGLVASCPFLYAEGAAGWSFLTDVIGIAPLAEWLPPGGTAHLDPEEFVRIPGDRLGVRDGRVRLAITEELKETTYLDRVELLFVDHGPDQELLLDENLSQGAYDELRIHSFGPGTTAPLAAALAAGRDLGPALLARDGDYARPYGPAPAQWGGWTPLHAMELTTGAPADLLLLEGRLAWYDSTVAYALHQNGRDWQPLGIDRIAPDGRTERLVANAGGPTGMDRTMVVPFGRRLPAGTRLRVSAQHRFLWDRIRTGTAPPDRGATHEVHGTRLSRALLYFHGYSAYVGDPAGHDQGYRFEERSPDDRYPRARGFANEYGDVTGLVAAHDDALAILVAGDGVLLEFAAPPVPPGRSRTWFLRISGWAKEGGFHNETGATIAPLPFRGMSRYPPPKGERTPWRDADAVLTRRVR